MKGRNSNKKHAFGAGDDMEEEEVGSSRDLNFPFSSRFRQHLLMLCTV
jgi:hypothetical protein